MRSAISLLFGRTAKNSFITLGASLSYGLLLMLFFALASRLLGPEKFGLLSIILAVFAISFDIFSLGSTQSLVRFVSVYLGRDQKNRARQFATAIFRFRIAAALFLIFAAAFIGKFLALNVYHNQALVFPFIITIAFASGILIVDYFITLHQAYEQFVKSASLLLALGIIRIISVLFLIVTNNVSVLSLTWAFVITPLIVSVFAFWLTPKDFLKASPTKPVVKKLINFSKWMALWGVTASLAGRIDILLMGKLTSAYETGIYSVAARLATGYIIIGGSFASVLTPKISRLIADKTELRRQFRLLWKVVFALIIGMIGLAFLSRWFIPFIFGGEYIQSVLVFQSLTIALIFFIANIPANVNLLSLGHSKLIGTIPAVQLVIVVSIGWWLIPSLGAQGAALALIISYFVAFVLSTSYAVKKIYS